jgi:hypothetical protein
MCSFCLKVVKVIILTDCSAWEWLVGRQHLACVVFDGSTYVSFNTMYTTGRILKKIWTTKLCNFGEDESEIFLTKRQIFRKPIRIGL